MTPITFLGKRYYIVHNDSDEDDPTCTGCVFETEDYRKCPNGMPMQELERQCDDTNRIYIHRTKKALAEWVSWKMDGFKEQK